MIFIKKKCRFLNKIKKNQGLGKPIMNEFESAYPDEEELIDEKLEEIGIEAVAFDEMVYLESEKKFFPKESLKKD